MAVRLALVEREFDIFQTSPSRPMYHVFDSHADDGDGKLVRFSRRITDTQRPWENTLVVRDGQDILGSGEDPRPFYWMDSVCVHSAIWRPGNGFVHRVYVQRLDRWFTLVPSDRVPIGKNWSPVVHGGALHFVHGFSPFRVMRAHFLAPQDNFLVLDIVAEHPIRTPRSRDKFSRYRGGSAAVRVGESYLGIGHTNQTPSASPRKMVHRPFVWTWTPGKSVSYHAFDFGFPEAFNIVDPTALFWHRGRLMMSTCETQYAWHVTGQRGRICLYELELDPKGDADEDGFGLGRGRLHRWADGQPSGWRRLLGARRRPATT